MVAKECSIVIGDLNVFKGIEEGALVEKRLEPWERLELRVKESTQEMG